MPFTDKVAQAQKEQWLYLEKQPVWVVPPCPYPEWLLLTFQVSRPVMEQVPYALKMETPESCLTLSARYGEAGRREGLGDKGQGLTGGKVWGNKRWVSRHFYFGILWIPEVLIF